MWGLVFAALLAGAPGDAPSVRYVTKVVTRSWEPLPIAEIERAVEAKALAELTRSGGMRLEAASFAELKKGDYTLVLEGRFIEEAEQFSVYMTFGPGQRSDLPSFHVSDTAPLHGQPRAKMLATIEALSTRAAQRLAEVLAPRLESARLQVAPPPLDAPELPVEWGPIEAPRLTSPTKAMRELVDPRQEDSVRWKALEAIKSQVFDQPAARSAVELCVLRDPTPRIRAACVEALAPVARAHVPTQRLLLHALRTDVDDDVIAALAEEAKAFVGLSRKECIETWLELVASDATPAQSASRIAAALAEEGDVPNLDFAVARCLQQEALVYGKKQACAQHLLRVIPPARRPAVVWKYLENVRVFEQGEENTLRDVLEATVGNGSGPVEPRLAELFLAVAERRSAGSARDDALHVVARHPAPTPALLERIFALAHDPALTDAATRAVDDLTERAPALEAMALGALKRLQAEAPFIRQKFRRDPRESIRETIKRLEARAQRRATRGR